MKRLPLAVILVLLSMGVAGRAGAAPPAKKAGTQELAVDLVELKPAGPTLRGAVLNRAADGSLSMAVPRACLRSTSPDLLDKHAAEEATTRRQQLDELLKRIDAWRGERPDQKRLAFFLGEERARVERLREGKDDPALDSFFVLLELPANRLRRVTLQPAARKQIALAAWQEGLADVETRGLADIEKELKTRGVDPSTLPVDLSDRLAPRRDSDSQWAARCAVIEYELVKPVDFQGTGDLLVRVGDDAKAPPLASLMGELLSSQLTRELGDLLGTPAPKKAPPSTSKATRAAEADGARGVRVSRVDQDLSARRVVVEESFLARMPDGSWQTVWSWTESADASKARPETEARIKEDPQVKQAVELVRKLGLGDGDDALQTAIRFGAAVMEAQKSADARFFRFRDACLKHVDGPPFPWLGPAEAK